MRVEKMRALSSDSRSIETKSGLTVYTLSSYTDRNVRAAIHTLKYHKNPKSIELCERLLRDALVEEIIEAQFWNPASTVSVVPIPLSTKRLKERGFNQIELMLSSTPETRTDILERTKHTQPQTRLSLEERLTNTEDAFSVMQNVSIKNHYIILVDDVVTTGATLTDAVRALKKAGAKEVLPIALARA